jgi:hypothetical protein
MENEFYAHSREGKPSEEWHRLDDHLKEVAKFQLIFEFLLIPKKGGES